METMDKLITDFPQNITDALGIAAKVTLRLPENPIHNVVICGMGGSGIGGKLVAQWIQSECPVPVFSYQDYHLPAFVGKHSLVIGSSYSGNTEETLIAIEEAHQRGAHIVSICSGGQLQQFCADNDYDCIVVPGGNPPRTAVGFSIVQLTAIFSQLGLASAQRLKEIESGRDLILAQLDAIHTEAKSIAQFLLGKVPVVYAGASYEAVAVRAKQQFNENSKELCWQHVIPEMNHNELVGWGGGDDRFGALFLQTGDLTPRNQRRFDISVELVSAKTKNVHISKAQGSNQIERSLYLIHLVDWASLYLSNLKNGDPMEIHVIDYLKDELSKLK
jgi:glucose/mannose-6-phosphate isomerase